ncbi:MAG: type IV pilus modification protein PilV [Panacagrimonas sp.]
MKNPCPFGSARCQRLRGFTLLEVLIAIVVISIGMLGVAGLQLAAVRSNTQSYERSQATALAYEMADKLRANRIAASEGAFNLEPFEEKTARTCIGEVCDKDDIAAFELERWVQRINLVLPEAATASITQVCVTDIPCLERATYTIRVMWNESRESDAGDASCPRADMVEAGTRPLACVEMSVSP